MTSSTPRRFLRSLLATVALGVLCQVPSGAQEANKPDASKDTTLATIRKNLSERLPNLPKIEEISKTPMPGLYEVRVDGADILYTDTEGNFLIQGALIDTKAKVNLTEQRIEKLTAIAFNDLPFKDGFTIVRGNGKRFERDLAKVDNVTVHVFLYPILGKDSVDKSKAIWCAKDKGKAFLDWMVKDVPPPSGANCDTSALDRMVEFGKKQRITGTPALFFVDGVRVPGAISTERIEKLLAEAKQP
jgi:thiol:disulfide interchange protein DsbC